MKVVQSYPDGMFSWIDLATTDTVAAKLFYHRLLGWEYEDLPLGDNAFYSMCQLNGKNVAGLSGLSPEMREQGVPPVWSAYINHSNVDKIEEKVVAAGGSVLSPPMDIFDSGRMAFFQDPEGAAFGVWQPKNHIGSQLVNMPNTLIWTELQTREPKKANKFYEAVFGWKASGDGNGYGMYAVDDHVQAGQLQITEDMGDYPANWTVYFMVEDIEAATAKVKELGGTVHIANNPAEGTGIFSVCQDPQGAMFIIMSFSGPVDPPPGYK